MNFSNNRNIHRRLITAGRALILTAPVFFALLLVLGLMIDLGQIVLAKGYLRRAAEAGAAAAAAEFRADRSLPEMTAAARRAVNLNGIDPNAIRVDTCATDASLCTPAGEMPAKPVRVTIGIDYPLSVLSLPDFHMVPLKEAGISMAAAMDVVLVIDVSESMAWNNLPDPAVNYDEDPANPAVCNADDSCLPFKNVKAAAASFAEMILDQPPAEELDRLAVVTFANGWEASPLGTQALFGGDWTNDSAVALDPLTGIPGLKVYDPGKICPLNAFECGGSVGSACPDTQNDIPTGPCTFVGSLNINDVYPFQGFNCARLYNIDTLLDGEWEGKPEAISACTTTNTGGGLRRAGEQFLYEQRTDVVRAVVVLTDGPANATFGTESDINPAGGLDIVYPPLDPTDFIPYLPLGFCPDGTWVGRGTGDTNRMFCQDGDVDTHHQLAAQPELYDADDFARDQAKFVACSGTAPSISCEGILGQDASIYTIGLGSDIINYLDDDPIIADRKPYGASLLRYIAAIGDDGDASTDLCAIEPDYSQNCGNYYFAQESTELEGIFDLIYARIVSALLPVPFGKLDPIDGATVTTGPTLAWDADLTAESYEYCYDMTDDDACDGSWSSAGNSTSAALSGLTAGTTYYWQARAVNAHGSTEADAGDWWSFTARGQTFADVPVAYWAWSYIERLYAAGITGGCASAPLRYCPANALSRAEMAVILERGMHGSSYTPPPAAGTVFGDVPISYWAAAWIEQLSADGITGGCGGGNYCPDKPVTRAEMAIFLLRAEHGSAYAPPAATGVFGDVPPSYWAAAWIEQLSTEGITGGCGGGNYCPARAVTRAEMAIFLVRTFGLP